ncbi:PIN domain-containing protein [Parabacteroides sp. ZJ-118]|uniref:type II toxin-antitoxin system VapC family toxin n=1 Tax=Parabacteroides sp. ZJ-118 TaxID=2709398 RepID=UPI0013E9BF5D|nr:PIN domain-containing protein [Parabacteroides sp. ZJ-118]
MKLFLDTNVIVDLLEDREPWVQDVMILFQLAVEKKVELLVSDLTIVNLAYITRKSYSKERLYDALVRLRKFVTIVEIGCNAIDNAIDCRYNDFEDAVQYFAAARKNVNYIITRNARDFSFSSIQVLTPGEFLNLIL